MHLMTVSAQRLKELTFPERSLLISMADSAQQVVSPGSSKNILARLVLIFNDTVDEFTGVRPPRIDDAELILDFVKSHPAASAVVIQCQVGVGRSQAVAAALAKILGNQELSKRIRQNGTYNKRLYSLLLGAAGINVEPEPLVSIAVRIKYAPDRLNLFLLSMKRQRYQNWEVIAITDGPNSAAAEFIRAFGDPRVKFIETEKRLGRWGHPYRQLGISACQGEFIGLSNDDNYYVPGYIEQMVNALEAADIALAQTLHSYSGWKVTGVGADLGCWVARAELVKSTPWHGVEFDSDAQYLNALIAKAGKRVAKIHRPLFVHN
jgi:predicted protein tyrosine phosphatase